MREHHNTLDDRQLSEQDCVCQDRHENDRPREKSSLPALNGIVWICKNDDGFHLLSGSKASASQRGMPAKNAEITDGVAEKTLIFRGCELTRPVVLSYRTESAQAKANEGCSVGKRTARCRHDTCHLCHCCEP